MALRTVSDIQTEFLIRNNRSTTDAFITDTTLNNWLTEAHVWAAANTKWPVTEGRVSTTYASLLTDEDGLLYGQYPEGWKSDSIRMLQIGGKRLDKKNFYDYRKFLEDNPGSQERYYTDYGGRYYINSGAGLSGTVAVWGQYTPAIDPTDKTAVTIFSDSDQEGNEAIIDKMTYYLKLRERVPSEADFYDQRAQGRLASLDKHINDEQFAYQTVAGDGMFRRIDIVRGDYRSDVWKRDQWNG